MQMVVKNHHNQPQLGKSITVLELNIKIFK